MQPVLQSRIPFDTTPRPLPGIQPLNLAEWLIVDDAYAGQMARRRDLIATRRPEVIAMTDGSLTAAQELLDTVLDRLSDAYGRDGDTVICPDGARVTIDRADPLATLGRICQEDFCLMQKAGDQHVLTAAVLCFPASWMLAEKIGRPLIGIHIPVASYDPNIAARVQRLFDGVQPGRPLWRFNKLFYADPELHQPRSESNRRVERHATEAAYIRSERQSLVRLPVSGAVTFSIHTFVVAADGKDAG
jgi:hypothetical protein